MLKAWRRNRAVKRVKRGDGRPLKRFRWWNLFNGRSLFHLQLVGAGGRRVMYSVDVQQWGDSETGEGRAHLYLDGRHYAEARVPAVFPVEGGVIEVAMSGFGVKRCHYVADDGTERQLTPDVKSAEGRRARLDRERPGLSRALGVLSVIVLVVGVGLNLVQILEPISEIPPVAENIGTFESPISLPLWLNITLMVGVALASVERALRLRYNWLLDGAAN